MPKLRPLSATEVARLLRAHGFAFVHPYAFTEQGVPMLSIVLRSERAALALECEVNRAFLSAPARDTVNP